MNGDESAQMKPRTEQVFGKLAMLKVGQAQKGPVETFLDKHLPWRDHEPWAEVFDHAMELWENPEAFEAGDSPRPWEDTGEMGERAYFQLGVLFGIEYEQAYPEGRNDEWPVPLEERPGGDQ